MARKLAAFFFMSVLVIGPIGLALRGIMGHAEAIATDRPAPEFPHSRTGDWLNGGPLRLADLRGRVVLLDFWTFDCWNCYRSIPWLKSVEEKFAANGLAVVGIHTPEFAHERVRANVEKKVREFGIGHPVMLDNDHAYWNAMGNRYWPAFYLVDRKGRLRAAYFGETHAGDGNALRIERAIAQLLDER